MLSLLSVSVEANSMEHYSLPAQYIITYLQQLVNEGAMVSGF